jgi:DUF1365 family protein
MSASSADPICFYEGTVRHRREGAHARSFAYRVFMTCITLGAGERHLDAPGLWSKRWYAACRFRRADYLGDPKKPLADAVRDLVEERLAFRPQGAIRLLSNLRTFGLRMNPVSFYFCYDRDDQPPVALVAEVTNTPWDERHCYALDLRDEAGPSMHGEARKEFHVSPFLRMNYVYRFRIDAPAEDLALSINLEPDDATADALPPFFASLSLRRRPFTLRERLRLLATYPWHTLRILAAIYWQALRLKVRGAPFVPHPKTISTSAAARVDATAARLRSLQETTP